MDHLPLIYLSPFALSWAAFATRVIAMGVTCAVLIWYKNRTGS